MILMMMIELMGWERMNDNDEDEEDEDCALCCMYLYNKNIK
jgi:hypothetical protein